MASRADYFLRIVSGRDSRRRPQARPTFASVFIRGLHTLIAGQRGPSGRRSNRARRKGFRVTDAVTDTHRTRGIDPSWVDEVLLTGPADQVALVFDAPVTRADLRAMISAKQSVLAAAGLRAGGSVALCL